MEIERKFLVRQLPAELEDYPKRHIQQGYLSTDPVLRVRQSGGEGWLTYKGPGLLAREEREFPLNGDACRRLLAKTDGTVIVKDRYQIPYSGYTIELDVFAPPLAPLVLAEVEFPTEAEAADFQPPEWFGEEVTYDPAYTNAAMSRKETLIRPGHYRHFKGGEYEVLYVAAHSETQEPMVVYRALYGERDVWVRPAAMWNETVERAGRTCRRFTCIEDSGDMVDPV